MNIPVAGALVALAFGVSHQLSKVAVESSHSKILGLIQCISAGHDETETLMGDWGQIKKIVDDTADIVIEMGEESVLARCYAAWRTGTGAVG